MSKISFSLAIFVLSIMNLYSQKADYKLSAVNIKDVVVTDNFWLPKIKVIQDSTIQYAFNKCESEGRMENFLIAGGKKSGKTLGKNPFDDTDLYKIIEGASYTLISKPNPKLSAYLDSIISIIKIGQEPDGYITTWFTIDRMNPPAKYVKPSKTRWEFEKMSHELYNSGHLFEAAAAHYLATGKRNFLDIALKNADLLVANFGVGKLQTPPGHQIVETGLIKLYRITKNQKYLELAKFFLDQRGNVARPALFGEYSQDHLPVTQQTEAVGHAVRAEYMYAAMTDIAAIYKDSAYYKAVITIWDNIVNKKMYLTGGVGARHLHEAFGENYELPNLTAYNETCAAIGSVYWNQRLFLLTGESKYYDIIERTLYNGLISGISTNGKKFFYPNPLESDAKLKFNFGSCTRNEWFDCSCCPTNLIRFIPYIPELIYATSKNEVFVNLYMSNNAKVLINKTSVSLSQQTKYPLNGKITITVNPETKTTFTLKLRVPGWAINKAVPGNLYAYTEQNNQPVDVFVNGKKIKCEIINGYIEIQREWIPTDKIQLNLPMEIRQVVANEKATDDNNKVAFEFGPLVYCAEEADNAQFSNIKISKTEKLNVQPTTLLSNKINVLKSSNMTLIPYYLWSNRGVGNMKVWFDKTNN